MGLNVGSMDENFEIMLNFKEFSLKKLSIIENCFNLAIDFLILSEKSLIENYC